MKSALIMLLLLPLLTACVRTVYVDREIYVSPSSQYLIHFPAIDEPISYEDYLNAYWGSGGYIDLHGKCNARLDAIKSEYPANGK